MAIKLMTITKIRCFLIYYSFGGDNLYASKDLVAEYEKVTFDEKMDIN